MRFVNRQAIQTVEGNAVSSGEGGAWYAELLHDHLYDLTWFRRGELPPGPGTMARPFLLDSRLDEVVTTFVPYFSHGVTIDVLTTEPAEKIVAGLEVRQHP